MCIETIGNKLMNHQYTNGEECIKDFELMFNNCFTYNPVSLKFETKISLIVIKIDL